MDTVCREKRSEIMSAIHSRDTLPEIRVRKMLWANGYRFRVCDRRIVGHPDIVVPKCRTLIEVRGCFWHQHEGCRYAVIPQTRQDYWVPKLRRNVERDRENCKSLRSMGWHVIVVWECEIRRKSERDARLASLAEEIRRRDG